MTLGQLILLIVLVVVAVGTVTGFVNALFTRDGTFKEGFLAGIVGLFTIGAAVSALALFGNLFAIAWSTPL
jgi:hypothetical protein